jgi:hypothetical protein
MTAVALLFLGVVFIGLAVAFISMVHENNNDNE